MASTAQRALRQSWQVTEKANPFMSKSGTKTTQKRNLNDMIRQQQPSNSNANPSILPNFLGRSFKDFLADTKGGTVNWAEWETTLRSNIARLVREEEKRETAFKRMMHRF